MLRRTLSIMPFLLLWLFFAATARGEYLLVPAQPPQADGETVIMLDGESCRLLRRDAYGRDVPSADLGDGAFVMPRLIAFDLWINPLGSEPGENAPLGALRFGRIEVDRWTGGVTLDGVPLDDSGYAGLTAYCPSTGKGR
jgi:hypothetical protein